MTLFRKLVLGLGLFTGWLVSGSVLACTPGQGPTGDPNCRGPIESSGWYNNGGGYVPPTVITLPDSWGAVATDTISGNTVSVSKQAKEQVNAWPCSNAGLLIVK